MKLLLGSVFARKDWLILGVQFRVKMTLRSAASPRRALATHSASNCISSELLKSHLPFTSITLAIHLSSVIHMSFTYGSLGQQDVQWMLHNWLNRAWKPASTKHYLIFWFSTMALQQYCLCILVPLISFQCPFSLSVFGSRPLSGPFHCQMPTMWPITETRRPTLIPLSVNKLPIFVSGKTNDSVLLVFLFFQTCNSNFVGHRCISYICFNLESFQIKD